MRYVTRVTRNYGCTTVHEFAANCNGHNRGVLFRLSAKALKQGGCVTYTQAVELYYQQEMMGSKGGSSAKAGAVRQKSAISSVQLVHQDSEHHVLLQALVQLLRYFSIPVYRRTS